MASTAQRVFRGISRIHTGTSQREGAGFTVVRTPVTDPFLMMDYFNDDVPPREGMGAPTHPHRGFETITIMKEGEWEHFDTMGNKGTLSPGAVQWMTAGSGVLHSEMPSQKCFEAGGVVRGYQLWLNLPSEKKMTKPRYQDIMAEKIPQWTGEDGSKLRVISGESSVEFGALRAVIDSHLPVTLLDLTLAPSGVFSQDIPLEQKGFVFVAKGSAVVKSRNGKETTLLRQHQAGFLDDSSSSGTTVSLVAGEKGAEILIGAAVPLNEPIARHGPFVMNTQEQIMEAFRDYQAGKFGEMPQKLVKREQKQTEEARRTRAKNGRY